MDLDMMLAEAAPAQHASLDGPDSPAAAGLYRRITAAPPPAARAPSRSRFRALAILTTAAAGLAATAALLLILGTPAVGPNPSGARAHLAAWSVARQPGGLVLVTIRELRDPVGLWRMLHADGVPANVRFLPHDFTATTSDRGIPRACHAPHMSARVNALLQAKITPLWPVIAQFRSQPGRNHGRPGTSARIFRNSQPSVVLAIRPSAIPHGIGLFLKAWAASPGTRSGPALSMQTDLVQVSPQCTSR